MTPYQCRRGDPPCCPLWPHHAAPPPPAKHGIPWVPALVLMALVVIVAAHALAAWLGIPPGRVFYAIGQSIGVLFGLAILAGLIIQLLRR